MKNQNRKMKSGLCVFSAGTLLAGTAVFASSGLVPPSFDAGDPSSTALTQTKLANQRLIDMQMKTVPHAAADPSSWFQTPSVFGEYGYNNSKDRRLGGFETDAHSGTAGLDFQTKGGVGIGAMVNYGSTSGSTEFPGHITDEADNIGLTLSAMKSIDWFYFGLSAGYDYSDALMVTPVGNRLGTLADSYTLSPFIGGMYVKGNFSFSVTPTMVFRWQEFGYNVNGAGTPGDNSSDATFVWMNKVSYNVTEKLSLALLANWTCVVDEQRVRAAAAQPKADDNWFTAGPKVAFKFTDKFSVYASYTIDFGTSTYENQQVTAGLTFNF